MSRSPLLSSTILCASLIFAKEAFASDPIKVVVDSATFGADAPAYQAMADGLAKQIESLIPGDVAGIPSEGILCEQTALIPGILNAPITLAGPLLPGESTNAHGDSLRIALFQVVPWPERFLYQLAHELAHVKMSMHEDNYLIETFAVAVAAKLLGDNGHYAYNLQATGLYLYSLPLPVQRALADYDAKFLSSWWRAQSSTQGSRIDDRTFQNVGAILILEDRKFHWERLLDVSRFVVRTHPAMQPWFSVDRPDIARMKHYGLKLNCLGL